MTLSNSLGGKAEKAKQLLLQRRRRDLLRQKRRLEAKDDLLAFTRLTKRDYSVNWHHRSVCDILNQFARGEIKKLMIFQPPQTGKSELSSRRFPAYILGKKPKAKVALCSYSSDLAQSFNRDVQRIIMDDEYKAVFPKTQLNEKNVATASGEAWKKTKNIFEIVGQGGYFKTVGVGGSLTGSTVDIGIIDDPFKDRKEAESSTIRKAVWDWYTDVFKTRLHNDSQQLILLTRWHSDDLAGRILAEDDDWTIISFPAIKETPPNEYDPREVGEVLWGEKHSLERMLEIKIKTPTTFRSLYQQNPVKKGGNIIKQEYFTVVNEWDLPEAARKAAKYAAVDTAYTKKQDNDPSACLIYSRFRNNIIVWHYWWGHYEFGALCKKLEETAKTWKLRMMYIEPKASGKSVVQSLKDNTRIRVKEAPAPTDDKLTRINTIQPELESGRVTVIKAGWNEHFFTELGEFPNGNHDESADCLEIAVRQGIINPPKGSSKSALI